MFYLKYLSKYTKLPQIFPQFSAFPFNSTGKKRMAIRQLALFQIKLSMKNTEGKFGHNKDRGATVFR